ncbi:hypothetical protein Tco_0954428 [Tanacetum coccineum]|uniref:Uncharacterized protein n=1 Tax=Tanacetum coccineum TaxID=301880 RepID=A0ABQ5E2X6_9ASTR
MMRENKSYEKHPTHQALYDAVMQSIILDEDDMEKAKIVEPPTQKKRQHDDKNQDPPARSDQGLKKRKTSKDVELSKKPTSVGDDLGNTDEQPNVEAAPKHDWFKKPQRAPTPDPEWKKGKSVDNEPTQNWLNDLANTEKPPLSFDDLMSTLIDFSTFAMNHLKISKLTKADLVGPVYNLLKGTWKSCVELEYNMEECYHALSDLSKPLSLQESRGRLTVIADFFFNNDLEYLR